MTKWPLLPIAVGVALIVANPQFDVPSRVVIGCTCLAAALGMLLWGRSAPAKSADTLTRAGGEANELLERLWRRGDSDPVIPATHPVRMSLITSDHRVRKPVSPAKARPGRSRSAVNRIELIEHGVRTRGIVTGMRATGTVRDGRREVELDVMVSRPRGGQFPAHDTVVIPEWSLPKVSPGSIVVTHYREGDESVVAVRVPRRRALSALRPRRR